MKYNREIFYFVEKILQIFLDYERLLQNGKQEKYWELSLGLQGKEITWRGKIVKMQKNYKKVNKKSDIFTIILQKVEFDFIVVRKVC